MAQRFSPPGKLEHNNIVLRPLLQMTPKDWGKYHAYFRDQEIAALNGSKPIRMPLWLFKRVVSGEERSGDRVGFALYTHSDRFIGSVELYDVSPSRPHAPKEATLGVLIGERDCWSLGFGSAACNAILEYAFAQLRLERVRLSTLENNTRARRTFEKVGFRLGHFSNGASRDRFANYILERSDWVAFGV